MFFQGFIRPQRPSIPSNTTANNMFSFLHDGDVTNTMRSMTSLPGLFLSDSDKIKYSILNYATAMRHNLQSGSPIFTNIRTIEAEIERRDINSIISGRLPSVAANIAASVRLSSFADNDIRRDNAALALIMAKELAFLNRTNQMISLIARRYQEEQEDAGWGQTRSDDDDAELEDRSSSDEDLEGGCDDMPSASPLQRSHSHDAAGYTRHERGPENQLVATFLVASGRLQSKFNNLCALTGTSIILVNGMTTMDQPRTEANREKQLYAEKLVIADIYMNFCQFDTEHRDPVVWAFLELRDISGSAWRILSMFAFSNLFRLTAGTEFSIYQPDNAIFTQGHTHNLPRQEAATADCLVTIVGGEPEPTTQATMENHD